jgi:hypothetical protein
MTGTGATASTTAGTNGSVATPPHTWPACLPALCNDDVHSTSDCAPRFLCTPDRVHDKPFGVMHGLDIVLGITCEQQHDPQTGGKCLIESVVLIGAAKNEIAGKGTVGECRRFTNQLSGVVGPRQCHAAESAGIGDRGGQAGIRSYRRLHDGVLNPQQLAHRRAGTHWDGPLSGARGAG